MTLSTFNDQYPSVVSMDVLSLLNQLSGPDATIPYGTSIKRVVRIR